MVTPPSQLPTDEAISWPTRVGGEDTPRDGGELDGGGAHIDSEELLPVALLRRNHAELLRVVREQEAHGKQASHLSCCKAGEI